MFIPVSGEEPLKLRDIQEVVKGGHRNIPGVPNNVDDLPSLLHVILGQVLSGEVGVEQARGGEGGQCGEVIDEVQESILHPGLGVLIVQQFTQNLMNPVTSCINIV